MDNEAIELLQEAQVAVAIAASTSNPEWVQLWIRIQNYLERVSPSENPHEPVKFFDSYGELWEACSCDHPEAENFGPRYCARRIPEGPNFVEACSLGRLGEMEGWSILLSERRL